MHIDTFHEVLGTTARIYILMLQDGGVAPTSFSRLDAFVLTNTQMIEYIV